MQYEHPKQGETRDDKVTLTRSRLKNEVDSLRSEHPLRIAGRADVCHQSTPIPALMHGEPASKIKSSDPSTSDVKSGLSST